MPSNRGKYTLEELLQAKREERPDATFWVQFDRELKTKQRMLLQKQYVDSSEFKSPLSRRIFRYASISGTLGFAAIAVVFSLRTSEQGTPIAEPSIDISPVPVPSFTMGETAAVKPTPSSGLEEFSTLAQAAQPRIQVVAYRQAPPSQAAVQSEAVVVQHAAPATAKFHNKVEALLVNDYGFSSAQESDLWGNQSYTLSHSSDYEAQRLTDFEREYILGKYADPLGSGITAGVDTHVVNRRNDGYQAVSISDIDKMLSSQGNRSSESSLDALTVRF